MIALKDGKLKQVCGVELSNDWAKIPVYATKKSAGCDFYTPENFTLQGRSKTVINTGVKLKIPSGYYLRLESRSGLSAKFGIEKGAGIIDEDYRDEIKVVLFNHGNEPIMFAKGDRICQGVFHKYEQVLFVEEDVTQDETSDRTGGLGSTGR